MEANVKCATSLVVHAFDQMNETFDVVASRTRHREPHSNVYRVKFRRRWCDCGEFQALRYPCAHAVAACLLVNVDPFTYVDDCNLPFFLQLGTGTTIGVPVLKKPIFYCS
ncbi:hypothetical protein GQ457_03G033830 [Hibiscus cannabinus]